MGKTDNKNYAVLIDSDNIAPKYISGIFDELSAYGKTPIRRLYGDFSKNSNWKDKCLDFSIKQVQQFNYTVKKSATDSTMIIDTMDLLYKEEYLDGFVIVSSDSDFTGLCQRLRESNKEVIGMGEKKTTPSLVKACTSFKYLENLIEDDDSKDNLSIQKDDPIILKIKELIIDNGNKMLVSQLKEQIQKIYNDFDVKNYGYNQMSKFLSSISDLSIEFAKDKTTQYVVIKSMLQDSNYESVFKAIQDILKSKKKKKINVGTLQAELSERGIYYKAYGFSSFIKFLKEIPNLQIIENNVEVSKN